MFELIKITTNENGEKVVDAKGLYLGLGLDKSHWNRWSKTNISNNEFFTENKDYKVFALMVNGNETLNYEISIDLAKHLCMVSKSVKAHEYRDYLIKCEKDLYVLQSDFDKVVSIIYGKIYSLDTAVECLNSMNNINGLFNTDKLIRKLIEYNFMDKDGNATEKAYKHKFMLTVKDKVLISHHCLKYIVNRYNKAESEVKMNTFESKTVLEYING